MAQYMIDNVAAPINFQGRNMLERTLQNAKNLLMCRMGEVPYDRYRGFDVSLFKLPMERFNNELLPELDRLMLWEPDVEVAGAKGRLMENGQVYIQVTLEVNDALIANVAGQRE